MWSRLVRKNNKLKKIQFTLFIAGFDDGFRAIERFSCYHFDLQVDVAVKQFQDLSEAF